MSETNASISHFYFVLGFCKYVSDGLRGASLYLQPCPASDISSSSVEFHCRGKKWPEWLQASLYCMNDIMTADDGIVWFWKSSIHDAVNRTVAVARLPRLLAKCLGLMQREMEGHQRQACVQKHTNNPHQICLHNLRLEWSGCRAAVISTFFRVVLLPWVTPVR